MPATASYERWRASRIPVVAEDLRTKHAKLAQSPFVLLRGTYYRFLEQFERVLPACASAPRVLAVGDLHVENFASWRDRDGRLAWGISDFDELDVQPYTLDLVRLATSAMLAIRAGHVALPSAAACAAILDGWQARIEHARSIPFVLAERHRHLYKLASEAFAPPLQFARTIESLPRFDGSLPKTPARLLAEVVPWPGFRPQLRTRTAGVGSLGSRRIVALGELDGGLVVREAKQIPGPATLWLTPKRKRERGLAKRVAVSRGVAADPGRRQTGKWVMRPLAPDATQLELAALRRKHDEVAILRDMGAEAANIHLVATDRAGVVRGLREDTHARGAGWLHAAADLMAALTERDHAAWCASRETR